MKKLISYGLVLVSLLCSIPMAHAASEIAFPDVAETEWYYNSILEMAQMGLLNGKSTDGVILFDPLGTMTRAEYVNIAVKTLYKDELKALNESGAKTTNWWDNAFTVAKQHGILLENDPNFSDKAGEGISREEMALILIRVAHEKGISTDKWVYQSQIPDFKDVSPYYQSSVRECYTLGLLNGTDSKGTFAPKGTLNRASAAQTFYKLLHAEKRTPVAPSSPTAISPEYGKPSANLQTWKEGEPHTPAQAGDTVIKADGTQVVLTMNQVGDSDLYLLGFGQGVDIITGTRPNPNSDGTKEVGDIAWYDDDGTVFKKYDVTGEVYTQRQWNLISSELYRAIDKNVKGSTDGERLDDYFHWNAFLGDWVADVP